MDFIQRPRSPAAGASTSLHVAAVHSCYLEHLEQSMPYLANRQHQIYALFSEQATS
jgi:hypothetical protein